MTRPGDIDGDLGGEQGGHDELDGDLPTGTAHAVALVAAFLALGVLVGLAVLRWLEAAA